MNGLAAKQEERGDNMGAQAARDAAEALRGAAVMVLLALLSGREGPRMLVGALARLTEATAAAERLHNRQLSAAMVRQAFGRADYDAGYEAGRRDGEAARPGHLRAV